MTVSLDAHSIILSGSCGVEEVDPLVTYLDSRPDLSVDLSAATTVHTALWQALMVFRPKIIGAPMSSLIADKLMAGLDAYLAETRKA